MLIDSLKILILKWILVTFEQIDDENLLHSLYGVFMFFLDYESMVCTWVERERGEAGMAVLCIYALRYKHVFCVCVWKEGVVSYWIIDVLF